ncbi:isopentenyl-diphosphate Delta-isomerase [Nakamurella sp. A5-74]|uniref:Isopentenyl-diphosphate Delta-isomerase n=1 Tax=Nakamurella sp. A5-74 TaxID=3158264 RepID=A0AAU8DTJ8_9ACTN
MHDGQDDDVVVLVDPAGTTIGTEWKSRVHTADTPLHLAFSVYLFDGAGNVLMTRRALSKATWPGVWTNSCCGHQRPGEAPADGVRRRTRAELGLEIGELRCVLPEFAYLARDAGGVMENEICPVFVGMLPEPLQDPRPDDSEVVQWTWVPWSRLVAAVANAPFAFSPWSVTQIGRLAASDDDLVRTA